jgi:IclR family acetate operon transcriptional repressor
VILSGLMNDHAICIDRIESTQPIKLTFERGRVQPLHKGASAKILLAYMDEKRQQMVLESLHQQGKIEDKLLFQQSLADIKEQGYVITSEEIDPGAWAIAVPIFGASNEILAGISIAAPKYRIDSAKEQAIIQQLLPNAIKLNEQMKLLGIDCI